MKKTEGFKCNLNTGRRWIEIYKDYIIWKYSQNILTRGIQYYYSIFNFQYYYSKGNVWNNKIYFKVKFQ